MIDPIQQTLDKIAPVVEDLGCRAELLGVEGGVATVRLTRPWHVEEDGTIRVRLFIERELIETDPDLTVHFDLPEPAHPKPPPEADVTIDIIAPDESVDTAILKLDRAAGSEPSAMYASPAEAEGNPLIQRMLAVPHVDAVMVKDQMLVVSRTGGTWPEIIEALRASITEHFAGGPAIPGDVDASGLFERITTVLDEQVNPAVASHGGKISLLEVRGSEVFLHMGGGCQGCGAAAMTLRQGVEQAIRDVAPEVTAIHDVTDHGAGINPYY